MPHLQGPEKDASKEASKEAVEQPLSKSSAEVQSGNGDVDGGDKLLSLVVTATKHAPPALEAAKTDTEDSQYRTEIVPPGAADHPDQPKVTPSPYGTAPHRGFEQQPPYYSYDSQPPSWISGNHIYDHRVMGGYAQEARRLFPSPLRYNRTKSEEEETDDAKRPEASPPRNNGYPFRGPPLPLVRPPFYGPPGSHPYTGYHHRPYGYDDPYSHPQAGERAPMSPIKKRSIPAGDRSPKRWKSLEHEIPKQEEQKSDDDDDDEGGDPRSPEGGVVPSKQRVISPSSSIEATATGKFHDDESMTGTNDKSTKSEAAAKNEVPATQERSRPARFPQQDASGRYGAPPALYQPSYYPLGPGMYGYPPPPHFNEGPPPHGSGWGPHSGAPPQYTASYPPTYSRPSMPQQRYPPPGMHGDSRVKKAGPAKATSVLSSKSSSPQRTGVSNIKSVAEWQRATLATGKAPSANRCMPLKAPIPSKYWGEAEKTKDCAIPDFHQLVNFPDYLNKVKANGSETPGATSSGKRPCVMCGKHRVCSASTANLGGNVMRRPKKSGDEDDEECDNHIIPRQNKGLCTACDVTVWVYVESGLEIKWCKGCKNFRPWAAFGDKGLATKCVRCRDRQREKYALQKDELRIRRLSQNSAKDEKRVEGHHEIAAAKGLRDLMAASATV